jgi:hypothetical protein
MLIASKGIVLLCWRSSDLQANLPQHEFWSYLKGSDAYVMPRLICQIRLRYAKIQSPRPSVACHCSVHSIHLASFVSNSLLKRSVHQPLRQAMAELYKKARSRIPAAMTFPPTWLRGYEEFVTKNASQVSQIESALRSLSYIIPGLPLHYAFPLMDINHTSFSKADSVNPNLPPNPVRPPLRHSPH